MKYDSPVWLKHAVIHVPFQAVARTKHQKVSFDAFCMFRRGGRGESGLPPVKIAHDQIFARLHV